MKRIAILLATLLYIFVRTTKCSNILVFAPSPWKSHVVAFQPLFLELAIRGHNVTVVSKFTVENPPPNYHQLVPSYFFNTTGRSDLLMQERSAWYMFFEDLVLRNTVLVDTTRMFMSDPAVRRFVEADRTAFDLVVVESFFQECTVALGHKYGAPVIALVPMAPWTSASRWAANPADPTYVKDFAMDGGRSLRFWERLTNAYVSFYSLAVERVTYLPQLERMMDAHVRYPGHETRPRMAEMLRNVSLYLIDSDANILSPRPYNPNFIEVPGVHVRPRRNVDEKLQRFLDSASAGVIYFNIGTILNVTSIPETSLRVLKNVLGRMEQKIVFKWINNDTRGLPANFYVDVWLPQREILEHPNCKLFITHGGIHGLMETISAGVPIFGLPVFGDQFQNMKTSQDNGIAIVGNIFSLTEESFETSVKLLLNDRKYSENIKRLSVIFQDRPMPSLDTAIYWVEYVIRHKGAHHLRSPAVDLPWYQYYLLDVIVFITSIILLFIYLCCAIVKRILRSIFNVSRYKRKTD